MRRPTPPVAGPRLAAVGAALLLAACGGSGGSAGTATGAASTGAAAATAVASVWTDRTDAQVYAMLGVTPMIGVNNTGGTTTVAAAKTLLSWAETKGLGFVRFWSVNRDNGDCADGSVSAKCSGISQDDYAFTTLFKTFT